MPRKKDEFRHYVKFLDEKGSRWECHFCGEKYSGGGTRIKAHLAKAKRYGIMECAQVDDQVRARAQGALGDKRMMQDGDGVRNENVSPRHHHSMNVAVPEDANQPINYPPTLGEDFLDLYGPNGSCEAGLVEVNMSFHLLSSNQFNSFSMDNHVNEAAENVSQAQQRPSDLYVVAPNIDQGSGEATADGSQQPSNVDRINMEFQVPQDPITNAPLENPLRTSGLAKRKLDEFFGCGETLVVGCSKRTPLVTTKLVGKHFQEKLDEICDCLMEDDTSIIGVYGTGGVGKTAIAMHVHNWLLENATFGDVFWVTMPHEFSVYELQTAIADAANIVGLSKDKDVKRRAAKLFSLLERKDKWVIILDGSWMHFKLEDVGIPKVVGGHKLLLTTRSLDVCRRMLCQEQIIIQPLLLDHNEGWRLFLGTLSMDKELSLEIRAIARRLVKKCHGLPLGIIEIATQMRGEENLQVWRDKLEMLKEPKLELEVFKALELSYRSLDDHELQQCFLHCALYYSNVGSKVAVMECFIDEELVHGIDNREKLHSKCCSILGKLRNAFLLDREDDYMDDFIVINPLFRDMALQMMSTKYMVKPEMNLKDMPCEEFWCKGIEKVSLAYNKIKTIPSYFSPGCPKLTTLLLNGNKTLKTIPDTFFKYLHGLKVLNFSVCSIKELPKSISNLVNLRALVLRYCSALHHIPNLGKLRNLRKLDLRNCYVLEELPEGLESLVNLRYLDLLGTKICKLPKRLLKGLENLQYLGIENVTLEARTKLKKLEIFDGLFTRREAFNACSEFIAHNSLHMYKLEFREGEYPCTRGVVGVDILNPVCKVVIEKCGLRSSKNKFGLVGVVEEGRSCDCCLLLPENVEELLVEGPLGMGALESLEHFRVNDQCHEMKHVVECERLPLLPSLRKILVWRCHEMEDIIAGSGLPMLQPGAFFPLTYLYVSNCHRMRKLFTHELSVHLPNLESLSVMNCPEMVEIIGAQDQEHEGSISSLNAIHSSHLSTLSSPCRFPKLKSLELMRLGRLKSISEGVLICDRIESIKVTKCPELERVPLQCPPPRSLREIRMFESEWESLEWGHPSSAFDKSLLRPLVAFIPR